MSARIWIWNAPFKMIGRPYYSKLESFEWEQLHFPALCCAVAWLKPIVEKHGEASAERMTLVKDDRLLKTWLMGMITSRERSCSPGKAGVPRDGYNIIQEKKATKCRMALSDTAPGCQTWLWGDEGASKLVLLLRAPLVVESLQTISSWALGSHPHLQRSVFSRWTQSGTKDGCPPLTVIYLEVWWKAFPQFKMLSAPSCIESSGSLEQHFQN